MHFWSPHPSLTFLLIFIIHIDALLVTPSLFGFPQFLHSHRCTFGQPIPLWLSSFSSFTSMHFWSPSSLFGFPHFLHSRRCTSGHPVPLWLSSFTSMHFWSPHPSLAFLSFFIHIDVLLVTPSLFDFLHSHRCTSGHPHPYLTFLIFFIHIDALLVTPSLFGFPHFLHSHRCTSGHPIPLWLSSVSSFTSMYFWSTHPSLAFLSFFIHIDALLVTPSLFGFPHFLHSHRCTSGHPISLFGFPHFHHSHRCTSGHPIPLWLSSFSSFTSMYFWSPHPSLAFLIFFIHIDALLVTPSLFDFPHFLLSHRCTSGHPIPLWLSSFSSLTSMHF